MREILNFDRFSPPVMPIQLKDRQQTVIQVIPPTVDLQDELQSKHSELRALLDGGNDDQRNAMWDIAARLMSCNRNMRRFTATELSGKYGLAEDDLAVFFDQYTDFLNELRNAKN